MFPDGKRPELEEVFDTFIFRTLLLMFVKMNITLWKWDTDSFCIKAFLDILGCIEVDTPVVC